MGNKIDFFKLVVFLIQLLYLCSFNISFIIIMNIRNIYHIPYNNVYLNDCMHM